MKKWTLAAIGVLVGLAALVVIATLILHHNHPELWDIASPSYKRY